MVILEETNFVIIKIIFLIYLRYKDGLLIQKNKSFFLRVLIIQLYIYIYNWAVGSRHLHIYYWHSRPIYNSTFVICQIKCQLR